MLPHFHWQIWGSFEELFVSSPLTFLTTRIKLKIWALDRTQNWYSKPLFIYSLLMISNKHYFFIANFFLWLSEFCEKYSLELRTCIKTTSNTFSYQTKIFWLETISRHYEFRFRYSAHFFQLLARYIGRYRKITNKTLAVSLIGTVNLDVTTLNKYKPQYFKSSLFFHRHIEMTSSIANCCQTRFLFDSSKISLLNQN